MILKQKYTDWLKERYNFKVTDFDDSRCPRLWRKFTMTALTIRGNRVMIRNLDKISEEELGILLDHELEHIFQQRKYTWPIFVIRYAVSQGYRMIREVAGFTRRMEAEHYLGHSISHYPKLISESLDKNYYLNSDNTKKALIRLTRNCADIKLGKITVVKERRDRWKLLTI